MQNQEIEKGEQNKKVKWDSHTFYWFMGLMEKRLPIYLLAIFVSTLGIAVLEIANSYLAKTIVNAAQTKQMDGIYLSVFINFLVIVGSMLLWRVGIIRYNIEGKRGVAKVEKLVFSKAMRLPMSYYEQNHSGDFMSKLIYDTEKAGDIYGSRLRRISAAILSSIIYLIPMFYYNWLLTLCLLGLSILTFLVNSAFIMPMKRLGMVLSKENGTMTEKLTNILAGIDLTKIFPIGEKIYHDYEKENQKFYVAQKKTNWMNAALNSLNSMFDLLGGLAFLGLGVIFVANHMINLGELTAIYTLYGYFRFSFAEIGRYLPQMVNCVANAQRVREFLEMDEEVNFSGEVEDAEMKVADEIVHKATAENIMYNHYADIEKIRHGRKKMSIDESKQTDEILAIKNVSFAYSEDRMILDDFSLSVKKGTSVAITGVSGRGKSTFAKLLLGFYRPMTGDICICGKNYKDMSLVEVRNLIAYVPQEPYLYGVSIAENIAYGRIGKTGERPSMDEIIKAAKAANAHDFIMNLPDGYDTIPGERGNQLSGGEKQRIAIARAIMKDSPILLLDEATSALDNESERLVNEAVHRLSKERTTIMIAHRESTIAMADIVCEM